MVRYFLGSWRTALMRFRVSTNKSLALLYRAGSLRNLPAVPSPLSSRSSDAIQAGDGIVDLVCQRFVLREPAEGAFSGIDTADQLVGLGAALLALL